ncbi:hypothetical protein B5P44_00310 [Mycobacterium sp. CBMA 213]|uniref:Uncharacterized protein n=1 Tax=Mycolicibacterium sp. CBMA 213 TaxID=1968788 RepID=A0A343VR40_9MYCO|nr:MULTISPECIES: hypothetical protein [unclassified Mycolicibacterium]AVN58364.1 hypothetical protein B5P44_p00069 [Mycolicibacterium sp. CBMA 213]MUL61028.1 hypothetical protein [Mycolicibacterium sp. CBMA 335]MUM03265.1 hypothetical protein [Mycolicibacterium sp. CBMA 213]
MTFRLAPPLTPVDGTSLIPPQHPWITWLNLVDSDKGLLANYRVSFPTPFSIGAQLSSGAVEIIYPLVLLISAHATAVTQLFADPDRWLTPLEDLYGSLTSVVYSTVPPMALAVAAFIILLLLVYSGRGKAGSKVQVSKAQWDRVVAGFTLMCVIAILSANPFRVIKSVVGFVLSLASFATHSGQGGVSGRIATAAPDAIRSLMFLINYGDDLAPECASQWSVAMNTGAALPTCAHVAAAGGDAFWAAVLALFYAAAQAAFVLIVLAFLLNNFSLTVAFATGAVYIGVAAMFSRRPFDPLGRTAAHAGSRGAMTLGYWLVMLLAPGWLSAVFATWTAVPSWGRIFLMAAAYAGLAWAVIAVSKNQETLLKLFRERIEQNHYYQALHQRGPDTVMGTLTQGIWDEPKAWATSQYRQAREAASGQWSRITQAGTRFVESRDPMATVIPDTPESAAALHQANTYKPDTSQSPIVLTGAPAAEGPLSRFAWSRPGSPGPDRIAVGAPNGTIIAGRPAVLSDLIPSTANGSASTVPAVFYRAGIPILTPPPDLLARSDTPTQPPKNPTATAEQAQQRNGFPERVWPDTNDWSHRLRAESAALTRNVDTIEVGMAQFADYRPGSTASASTAAPEQVIRPHTILDSAGRTHRLNHHRRLLQARGIVAPVTISDDDEAEETIAFFRNRQGRIRVESRHGWGFGDAI